MLVLKKQASFFLILKRIKIESIEQLKAKV
jgi:hypothetical protein